jgi:hypothetical protein
MKAGMDKPSQYGVDKPCHDSDDLELQGLCLAWFLVVAGHVPFVA